MEYYRTDKGLIIKVKQNRDLVLDLVKFWDCTLGNIIKHSKNIIDLIEVGDIVEVQNKLDGSKTIFNLNKYIIGIYKEQLENGSIKLTSILTHEMYEQNCYKVGED